MSDDTIITRSKGGTEERQERAIGIAVPDLWHIAMGLPKPMQDMVLECWHLAHDLLKHIKEQD